MLLELELKYQRFIKSSAAGLVILFVLLALVKPATRPPSPLRSEAWSSHSPCQVVNRPAMSSVQCWVVDDSRKLRRDETPQNDAIIFNVEQNQITLAAAGNEVVSFQLILRAPSALKNLTITVSDLIHAGDHFPAAQIELFLECYLYAPAVAKEMVALPDGDYPDALIPFIDPYQLGRAVATPFVLQSDQNQGIWLDVKVLPDFPAGSYVGQIRLYQGDDVLTMLGLRLQILDFNLPAQRHTQAWVPLYWGRLARNEGLSENNFYLASNWPVLYRYYRMAFEHRFWSQISDGVEQPELHWNETTGKLLSVSWQNFDSRLASILSGRLFDGVWPALWKVGGWIYWGARPGDRPYFGGNYQQDASMTAAHRQALSQYVQAISRHFQEQGWNQSLLFMYMIDEPDYRSYPNLPRLVAAYGMVIRSASDGKVKHLVTVEPVSSPEDDAGIDIYATTAATYWLPTMQRYQAEQKLAWFYQYHEPFVGGNGLSHEALGFRSWPWIAARYDVDGIFYWVGNFWPDHNVYRDALNWNEDEISNGILFYPGNQLPQIGYPAVAGPLSSIRMKMLRRGLQDIEYFWLAKQIDETGAKAIVKKIIRSALNEREYDPYWQHPLWAKPGDWSHDPRDWYRARLELAKIILSVTDQVDQHQ